MAIKKRREVFRGRVLSIEEVELDFDGTEATYELVNFNVETGVSALPVTKKGEVILIKHYQLGLDGKGWSLVTGGLEQGEDPKERMQWELMEEIGHKANKLTFLSRYNLLPSYIGGEPGYLYLAEELEEAERKGDEEYQIETVALGLSEALEMVRSGEIADIRTAYSLLYYRNFLAER